MTDRVELTISHYKIKDALTKYLHKGKKCVKLTC